MKTMNKSKIIAGSILLALLVIGGAVYAFVIPRYNMTITNAEVLADSSKNGVKHIESSLKLDCNVKKTDVAYVCEQPKVAGEFSSNKKSSATVTGDTQNVDTKDGKISFSPKQLSFKAVPIRESPVKKEQTKQYKIVMRNEQNKEVIVYTLTIQTNLTDSDLEIINKSPVAEEIKTAIQKIGTITDVCVANEDNDPNGRLGKPGNYYIKVIFVDSRAPEALVYDESTGMPRPANDSCEKGNEAGGSIEVFKTKEEAVKRKTALDGSAGSLLDAGTSKIVNTSVIRTSSEMKASQQTELESQLVEVLTK